MSYDGERYGPVLESHGILIHIGKVYTQGVGIPEVCAEISLGPNHTNGTSGGCSLVSTRDITAEIQKDPALGIFPINVESASERLAIIIEFVASVDKSYTYPVFPILILWLK